MGPKSIMSYCAEDEIIHSILAHDPGLNGSVRAHVGMIMGWSSPLDIHGWHH